MDISEEVVPDLVASDILEQNQKPDSTFQEAKSIQEGISRIVRSGNGVLDITISDRLQQNHNPDSQVHELESNQEKDISMASLKNGNSDGHSMLHEESLNREGTADVIPGDGISKEVASDELKQSKSPEPRARDIQVSQEGISSTVRPEKALEDGYNWRKYGQKNVRGNEFIRSYYKCTHHTCLVKKQVERSHDGQIMDTLYLGTHDHPKAQPISVAAGSSSSIQEEKMGEPLSGVAEKKSSNEHVQTSHQIESTEVPRLLTVAVSETDPRHADSGSNRIQEEVYNHENLEPKRRKQDSHNVDATRADKQTGESRIVVRTTSEVDIVNDGYRWRKYGQKLVKGNPNPRSYYRCSSAGCPVKKQVERASHDPKVVITTYERQHDHDMPPARTVTPNTLGSNTNPTVSNDESRAESEETDLVGHEVIVQYSLNSESSRSNEHCPPEAAPVHS